MTAPNDEGPVLATPALEGKQQTTGSSVPDAERKRFETIRARLAIRGYELRQIEAGAWIIVRWNLARHCREFAEVEAFAAQAGAI